MCLSFITMVTEVTCEVDCSERYLRSHDHSKQNSTMPHEVLYSPVLYIFPDIKFSIHQNAFFGGKKKKKNDVTVRGGTLVCFGLN